MLKASLALTYEKKYWQENVQFLVGVDEVGRGPLAGPVVASAVILPQDSFSLNRLTGLTDSKKLNERSRQHYFRLIQEVALDYSLGIVSAEVIDRINILQATFLAMRRALNGLEKVEHVLVDGNRNISYCSYSQEFIVKGDSKSLSIAAASVLAKVTRDTIMKKFDQLYPGYGFAKHKGYPSKFHREQVRELGLCLQHRKSFCRKILDA